MRFFLHIDPMVSKFARRPRSRNEKSPLSRGEGVVAGTNEPGIPFPFISEEADDALEIIFEHVEGIASEQLARALELADCAFLIEELRLAGIAVRSQIRDDTVIFLAPLRFPYQA